MIWHFFKVLQNARDCQPRRIGSCQPVCPACFTRRFRWRTPPSSRKTGTRGRVPAVLRKYDRLILTGYWIIIKVNSQDYKSPRYEQNPLHDLLSTISLDFLINPCYITAHINSIHRYTTCWDSIVVVLNSMLMSYQ